jgi:hypothetical protein
MARTPIGSNLNTFGDTGHFETDRSTWGFPDPANVIIFRSALFAFEGLYAARCFNSDFSSPPYTVVGLVPCRFPVVAGKKYVMKAKVRVPSDGPIADGARVISLSNPGSGFTTLVAQVTKTITQALDAWVDIETYFECITPPPYDSGHLTVSMSLSGAPTTLSNPQGFLDVDKFEVYEYVDTEDPAPTCTLLISRGGTIVVNESAPGANDGSINLDHSGGTGPFEYSKDGVAWQLSSLFTGLSQGSYGMFIREQANPSCVSNFIFDVNSATLTFDFTGLVTNESISGASDGVIAITVTGTGGAFKFVIDGAPYQLSNIFPGLPPGEYLITVFNNAESQSLTKPFTVLAGDLLIDKTWHSKNPVFLERAAAAGWELLTNYRLYNEVRVEDVADSGIFTAKLKVDLPPDNAGIVVFYNAEAFRDAFTFTLPSASDGIKRLTDRIKRFKNFTGELQDDEITPSSLEESTPSLVLWGGVSKEKYPGLNYFTTYLTANKKFLTWAPIEKYVDRNQEDYLNFFAYGNFNQLKLQIKAYYDDNTNQTSVVGTISAARFRLYQFPAGPANSGALLIDGTKTLVKYEIRILNQSDAVISEVRTFYVVQQRHPLTRHFMFQNSLGTFEVLRFTGQANETTGFQREILQRFLPHNYVASQGEFLANSIQSLKRNSYSSGYIKDRLAKQWNAYMEDFMLSPRILEVTNGLRKPVVITSGDINIEDQNYERYFRFEAKPAYDNDSFTPEDI